MVLLDVLKSLFLFLKEYFMGNYPLANYVRDNPTVKFLLIFYFVVYVACFYVLEQGFVATHSARAYIAKTREAEVATLELKSQADQLRGVIAEYETIKLEICGEYPYYDPPNNHDNIQVCRIMNGKRVIPLK